MMNRENDVILAALKLSRAMRRCPPDRREFAFPPAAGRLLECVAANSGVSSRELCEMLDVRPSSLSEMLARAESEGWVTRAVDEDDRRIQRVDLSEKGREIITRMREAREADYARKTACFSEEEKAVFCALCNRLSDHMESLASDVPESMRRPPRPGHPGFPPDGDEGFPPRPSFPAPPESPQEKSGDDPAPKPRKPLIPGNVRIKC